MSNYGLTEEDFEKSSPIEEDFEIIEYVNDHRFGDIALLQNKEEKDIILMLKEKFSDNVEDASKDIF